MPRSWLAVCDRCGAERKSHELRLEWTGLRVCRIGCWEARHPQDFVKAKPDDQTVPWVRPEPDDVFLYTYYRREDGTVIYREDGTPLLREA